MSYLRYNPISQSENNYFRTGVLDAELQIIFWFERYFTH